MKRESTNKQADFQNKKELIFFSLNQIEEEVYWITPAGQIVYTNKTAEERLRYLEKELLQMYIWDIVPEYDKYRRQEHWNILKEKGHLQLECMHKKSNDEKYPAKISNYYLEYMGKEYEFSFAQDISRQKNIEKEYKELIESMNDTAWVISFEGKFLEVNSSAVELLGYDREELLDLGPQDIDGHLNAEKISDLVKNMRKDKKQLFETVHITKEGKRIPVEISSSLVTYKGEPAILSIARDITERKKNENKIKYLSYHDKLTGLYNRDFFDEEVKRLDVERQLPISLIIADLNGLKFINDTYGHIKGDMVLKKTADILKHICRDEDIIARWGGDEFIVILPKTKKDDAQKICSRLESPSLEIEIARGEVIPLSVAVGVAVKEDMSQDIYEVLKDAEDRMYHNKIKGSDNIKNQILQSILNSLHKKCNITKGHILRLQNLGLRLGRKINLSRSDLNKLKLIAIFHDIGKAVLPSELLNNEGKLNKDEWYMLKKHPIIAYRIITSTKKYAHIADEVLSHHENWDGTGYPRGLKGEGIPLLARIIRIVDFYDSMTYVNDNKKPVSEEKAKEELKKNAGKKFDPTLVDIFIEKVLNNK